MHLPHYAVTTDDDQRRPRAGAPADRHVQAASVHAGGQHGVQRARLAAARAASAPATCWSPTRRSSARCSAATRACERFWKNIVRRERGERDDGQTHRRSSWTTSRAGFCARGRRRTRRPTSLLRIDDREAGRELMRRLQRRGDLGRRPDEPGRRHLGQRRAHLPRAEGAGRAASVARQLRLGVPAGHGARARKRWATPARAAPSTGSGRSARRTSTSCSSRSRPTREQLESALARARAALRDARRASRRSGGRTVTPCPPRREPFGFRDGISHPAIEGSGIPGTNPHEAPLKAGEFVLGYRDEMGGFPPMPRPDVLGRNGTYVAFRKLHQRVAAFRRYLKDNAVEP